MSSYRLSALVILILTIASCKKDPGVAPYGKMVVSFSNEVDGQPVAKGILPYVNASGNRYSVDLLKYYVTNFTLLRDDSTERNFKNYSLIDAFDPASLSFTLDSVVNGNYSGVKFYLGVDPDHNHSGNQDGGLDPVNGMIWTWNTGYIFFKHDGSYKDSTGGTVPLVFHYGSDKALCSITIPIPKLTVEGNTKKLSLKFNLNSLYSKPNVIDFDVDNNRQSTQVDDKLWLSAIRANFTQAFTYSKAE